MFRYFPDKMIWSQAVMIALNSGGEIGEVDRACQPLRQPGATNEDWWAAWTRLGEELEGAAAHDEAAGHPLSAANKYRRACAYYAVAERMVSPFDQRKLETYGKMREMFARMLSLGREPAEAVAIPYENGVSLPALFVPGQGPPPRPTCIFLDGFDIMKELIYLRRVHEATRRGLSLLIVDTPGVGEALRLLKLPARADTEVPVGYCVDYLERRPDVDPARIGVIGISLGGYYAPRAASFEHRLALCIAWGAIWNAGEVFRPLYAGDPANLTAPPDQLLWVTGTDSVEEGLSKLDEMSLEGVIEGLRCPLLVLHGEEDHLVPAALAERTVAAAVNAPRRDLVVIPQGQGGAQHCQMDVLPNGTDIIFDWAADVLDAGRAGR